MISYFNKHIEWFAVLFVITASLLSVLSLAHAGYFPIHDDVQIIRIIQMSKALSEGQFPVRWVSDLGYGYGYPIFNFYAPLPYYIGSFFKLIGFGPLASTKIMMGIGLFLASVSMYLLGRKVWGIWGGVIAAIAYQYAPYHAVQLYVRGAIGEMYAYAFLPLAVYGLLTVATDPKRTRQGIIIGTLGFIGILLSHNIISLIFTIVVVIAGLVCVIWKVNKPNDFWKRGKWALFIVLVSFGISAFFWMPALFEKTYTAVDQITKEGSDYHLHFLYIDQLWDSAWGFAGSAEGRDDGMSFKIGKLHIILALIGAVSVFWSYWKSKSKERKTMSFQFWTSIFSILLLIFSIFMTLQYSTRVWDSVPILAFVQFPWRFLVFVLFFISLLTGGISIIFARKKGDQIAIAVLISIAIVFVNVKYFQPQNYIILSQDYFDNKTIVNWDKSKISDEYLPAEIVRPQTKYEVPKMIVQVENGTVTKTERTSTKITAMIQTEDETTAIINQAYFPGWVVYIDDVRVNPTIENGLMTVHVDSGTHTIKLLFKNTIIRSLANIVSVVSVFVFFGTIIWLANRHHDKKTKR